MIEARNLVKRYGSATPGQAARAVPGRSHLRKWHGLARRRPAPPSAKRPASLTWSRAFYDEQRARGPDHDAALRALSNRLVGILHGCLKTRTLYDEATAWSHRANIADAA